MICQNMKSTKLLEEFIAYCEAHPQHRFWQALRNWSEIPFIGASNFPPQPGGSFEDTFYWTGRDGMAEDRSDA